MKNICNSSNYSAKAGSADSLANLLPYNDDVTHCMGARSRLCTRCYRFILLKQWQKLSPEDRGVILLRPGLMQGVTCTSFFDVEKVVTVCK